MRQARQAARPRASVLVLGAGVYRAASTRLRPGSELGLHGLVALDVVAVPGDAPRITSLLPTEAKSAGG